MTLLIYITHGGRSRRYKTHPRRLNELLDPWERRLRQFDSVWLHDLFLFRRANPTVERIEIRPEALSYVVRGQVRMGVADLAVFRSGRPEYEVLLFNRSAPSIQRADHLRIATEAHGLGFRETHAEDLQRHITLLDNMRRIRQGLVTWLDYPIEGPKSQILSLLGTGPITRGVLKQRLDCAQADSSLVIDVAIWRLFFEQRLTFDLAERYGDDCVIIGR